MGRVCRKHDATLGGTVDGGLVKNGIGSLTLTGANTFTGAVVVNSGTVVAGNVQGLGTGGLVIHSAGKVVLPEWVGECGGGCRR